MDGSPLRRWYFIVAEGVIDMMKAAAWYAGEWHKFHKSAYAPSVDRATEHPVFGSLAMLYVSETLALPIVAASVSPYVKLHQVSQQMDWALEASRPGMRAPLHNWSPKLYKFGKRGLAARIALRIGSRAIPYVGWSLLVYDLYSVGKWFMETDF